MVVASAEAVRPPERLTVSQAAEKYHIVNNPGTHVGPFSLERTPYLVEPMDELQSLDFTGEISPAPPARQIGHGAELAGAYTAICDPADMMFVNMTQNTARDWSQGDLARMMRYSPEVRKRLVPGRQNDNVHDKRFLSGMRLLIKWPTISELSGKTIPRCGCSTTTACRQHRQGGQTRSTSRSKRAQTYRRFGMTSPRVHLAARSTNPNGWRRLRTRLRRRAASSRCTTAAIGAAGTGAARSATTRSRAISSCSAIRRRPTRWMRPQAGRHGMPVMRLIRFRPR
jgi:phage terminase large subunit GpA-like protein